MVICTHPQKCKLCLLNNCEMTSMRNRKGRNRSRGGGGSVIKRVSPKCKLELRKALRFEGWYDFMGNLVLSSSVMEGSKVFEVLDFGPTYQPNEDGRIIHLKYYAQTKTYAKDVSLIF